LGDADFFKNLPIWVGYFYVFLYRMEEMGGLCLKGGGDSMKRRILIRVLSFILSLTMILGSTGMSAFAESMSDVSENDGIVEITEPAIETPDITSGDIAVEEPDVTSDDIQLPDDAIEEPDETADVSSDDEIVEDIIEDDSDVSENELYGDALGVYYTGKISVKVGDKTKNYEGDKIPEGLESRIIDEEQWLTVQSPRAGILTDVAEAGKEVRRGDLLARIFHPYEGRCICEVKSPCDGIVFFARNKSITYQNTVLFRILKD